MQTLDNFNFAGKKAFVRVDFNVPLDENLNITDDTRMRAALPTLKKIIADGGSVIIGSHLGRPKKGPEDKFSLKHVVAHLSELLGQPVKFVDDSIGEKVKAAVAELKPGEVLVLENLRFYAEEEGKPRGLAEDASDEEKAAAKKAVKASQKEFTKELASLADVYVNDAFGTAHRAHASTALIADYFTPENKMFGYLMEKEVKAVEKVMKDINRPFTAIMGGSKVSSKIEIIENLLNKVDNLIITGGMTYTFTKAQGGKIGNSICEDDKLDLALDLMKKAKEKGIHTYLATNPVFPRIATMNRTRWAGLDAADFELITTYEDNCYCKPNIDYYRTILEKFDLTPETCLMVGNDVEEDLAIRELGVKTFLLTDTMENKKDLPIESDYQGTMEELLCFIERLENA
mgnify:CR=1 FL=1